MRNNRKKTKLSSFLTKILRHSPSEYNLTIDDYGYCDIQILVDAIKKQDYWGEVTVEDIIDIVDSCEKQRFEIDGKSIRARYGHSIPIILKEESKELPEVFYHGTNEMALLYIGGVMKQGLREMERQFVHLSETPHFAMLAAQRRKCPKVIKVDVEKAVSEGVSFHYVGNEVWLSTKIPFNCLIID